jgi:hypothetical protein
MLDIPVYMGVNAPRDHQRMISKLIIGLGGLFYTGKIPYEPFPEAMIDETRTSPTPDIILTDNIQDKDILIIEISGSKTFNKDFEKVVELVEDYALEEGFVYDYKKTRWRKYKNGIGEILENPSFCDAIGYDLNDFVK